MRRRRIASFLAQFLDTRAPALFLIGSIALSVLGNAIYSLLLLWFGESFEVFIGIIIGALFILPFVAYWLRHILERLRLPDKTVIRPEEAVSPHTGVILLVSPNPAAAEWYALQHHLTQQTLRYCWLISSPEVDRIGKARDLHFRLSERNVQAYTIAVADANQALLAYEAVEQALKEARAIVGANSAIIVDITGGTKPMTAGAVLACRDYGVPIEYMVAPRDERGEPRGMPLPMKVQLEEILQEQPV